MAILSNVSKLGCFGIDLAQHSQILKAAYLK